MSIKIQQLEIIGNNTKYAVNYNNQQNRIFIVPNDKKNEFTKKYPQSYKKSSIIGSAGLILACGLSAIGGNKLLSKVFKKPSAFAKLGTGTVSASVAAFAYLVGASIVQSKFDKKVLNKYGATEVTEKS